MKTCSPLPPPPTPKPTQASVAAMTSNQLPARLLPYHMTSFPEYKGSAFGFGVMVIQDWEVAPGTAPEGEVRVVHGKEGREGGCCLESFCRDRPVVVALNNPTFMTLDAPTQVSWAGMASNSWWISPKHKTALLAMTQVSHSSSVSTYIHSTPVVVVPCSVGAAFTDTHHIPIHTPRSTSPTTWSSRTRSSPSSTLRWKSTSSTRTRRPSRRRPSAGRAAIF